MAKKSPKTKAQAGRAIPTIRRSIRRLVASLGRAQRVRPTIKGARRRLIVYRVAEGSKGTSYSFAEVAFDSRTSILITSRTSARKVLGTPVAIGPTPPGVTLGPQDKNYVLVVVSDEEYGALLERYPGGRISFNTNFPRRDVTSIFSTDSIAASYLKQNGIGADALLNRMAQGLAKVADRTSEIGGAAQTGIGGLATLIGGFVNASQWSVLSGTTYVIGVAEVSTAAVTLGVTAAFAGGVAVGTAIDRAVTALAGDSIGGMLADWAHDLDDNGQTETAGNATVTITEDGPSAITEFDSEGNATTTVYDENGEIVSITYTPAEGEPQTIYERDDDDESTEDEGDTENSDDGSDDEDAGDDEEDDGSDEEETPAEDEGGLPADPDSAPLAPQAVALINWVLSLPGVDVGTGPNWDILSPLILVTPEPQGDIDARRLSIRLDKVTRPKDDPAGGSSYSRGSGYFRVPGAGVIDYAEVSDAMANVLPGDYGPGASEEWTCPWIYIPGGDCGYLYCPVERHPMTGAPIQQLVPAPCSAQDTDTDRT
jgi:hypothetical protein